MNEHFVCVKVDREERPDVDALYMEAVQAMTGQGGWPLNVFLTPEQVPFYGGTYFPPEPRHGMPAWTPGAAGDRRGLERAPRRDPRAAASSCASASRGGALLRAVRRAAGPRASLDAAVRDAARDLRRAQRRLRRRAEVPGRLGARVPAARAASAQMTLATLRAMARGGIHDQVGGGFARYSVDAHLDGAALREDALRQRAARARLPARLAALGGDRAAATHAPTRRSTGRCARCARPRAASTRALDADSEGVEGALLRLDARRAARRRSARTPTRRSPGSARPSAATSRAPNVPRVRAGPSRRAEQRERIRARLLAARASACGPALDDKRLTSWNALMIAALADAGARARRARDYLDAARAARRVRARRACATTDGPPAAHATTAARRSSPPTSRTTRSCSRRCSRCTRRPSRSAGSREARALADEIDRALRRPRARRLLLDRRRPRAADRAAQGPRGHADPLGRVERRARPAAPRAR